MTSFHVVIVDRSQDEESERLVRAQNERSAREIASAHYRRLYNLPRSHHLFTFAREVDR